jgi:hypothetical protein
MTPKIYPSKSTTNFKFKHFFEKCLTNLKPKIVSRIHEAGFSRQGEFKNRLTQNLEPTPTIVWMDVETEILFDTSSCNVGMPKFVLLYTIATPTTTKQRLQKIDIIKKL